MTMQSQQPSEEETGEQVAPALGDQKPKSPFDSADKVVRNVQLLAVQFNAFSAHALQTADTIPEDATFAVSTKFLRPMVVATDSGFSTRTTLVFQASGKLPAEEDSAPRPYTVVQATIEAAYGLKPDSPGLGQDELRDYALYYCHSMFGDIGASSCNPHSPD